MLNLHHKPIIERKRENTRRQHNIYTQHEENNINRHVLHEYDVNVVLAAAQSGCYDDFEQVKMRSHQQLLAYRQCTYVRNALRNGTHT